MVAVVAVMAVTMLVTMMAVTAPVTVMRFTGSMTIRVRGSAGMVRLQGKRCFSGTTRRRRDVLLVVCRPSVRRMPSVMV